MDDLEMRRVVMRVAAAMPEPLDPRTIQSYLEGRRVIPRSRRWIETALRELKLTRYVRGERAA